MRRLASVLRHLAQEGPVVLGLPRGGVPVAFQVAQALGAPLDVTVVRKLGVPYHRELGFGAIGEGGVRVISEDIVAMARVRREDWPRSSTPRRRSSHGRPGGSAQAGPGCRSTAGR